MSASAKMYLANGETCRVSIESAKTTKEVIEEVMSETVWCDGEHYVVTENIVRFKEE